MSDFDKRFQTQIGGFIIFKLGNKGLGNTEAFCKFFLSHLKRFSSFNNLVNDLQFFNTGFDSLLKTRIFFKVSGGFKARESSSDLGIALALLSSYFQVPLPKKSVAIAEIGLTGQIRPANQIDVCIKEIEKFGLDHLFIAESQKVKSSSRLTLLKNIYELLRLFPEQKGQEGKSTRYVKEN